MSHSGKKTEEYSFVFFFCLWDREPVPPSLQTDKLDGTFKDVTAQQSWSAAYIEASHRMGIINGFTDGTF
ncbi:S-layer homology domain-containing protein [Rossellomorea sp. YZS02]|uniref:S-layer homology domain-containing protein n=1 Tax=Rossellomorea sp. YZS02 TaxID=3097358 RepID=UPI002A0CF644|nr:S-layer homology domain-containing protein [Rossellomorea sp. YZS02]MDX8346154.1 S-layer homology domain-containing protein [Rossellomorea sp. YZS02]